MSAQSNLDISPAMVAHLLLVISASCISSVVTAATLPPFIKPCARNDPNFDDCAKKHGEEVIPHLAKGDRRFRFIPLDPLQIVEIKNDNGLLKLSLQNSTMYGFKDTTIEDMKFDFENKKFHLVYKAPKLVLVGKYEISGRLIILPINGQGQFNSTIIQPTVTNKCEIHYYDKKGEEYMILEDCTFRMVSKRSSFHLENLFNGNQLLGREMNDFMNENWKEMNEEFLPPVVTAIGQTITNSINDALAIVPKDVVFPLKEN